MQKIIPEYMTLVEVLQDAILKESDAEQFYLEASSLSPSTEVRQFLIEMAKMEKEHFDLLSKQLESLKADQHIIDGILSSYDENPES
jgi:rubrerythrin